MKRLLPKLLLSLFVILTLSACEEEEQIVAPQIRAIKTFIVTDVAEGQVLKFPGAVEAADVSSLSFPVAGTVVSIEVKAGERIIKGQVLAMLDKAPFELDVNGAEAELQKARSLANEKLQEFERKEELFGKGWVARVDLEQAQAAMETARSDVGYSTSKLNLAKRSVADTIMHAPFDGVIGERSINSFVEIAAGEQVLVLNAEGALNVAINVPENTVARLHIGMPATIKLSSLGTAMLTGRVTEISAEGGAGNIFAVQVSLDSFPMELRSGMTAEVMLSVIRQQGTTGFLIPISAISPGDEQSKGYVYVYQSETTTVMRIPINPVGAADNLIAVTGLEAGDQIASAGVTFLRDGQKVKLMSWPLN